jgi:tRNA A37 methylthiotransferase MiaB
MIAGFNRKEEDHQDTLSLMEYVKYNFGYMYSYSERPGTLAGKKMEDDVSKTKAQITRNCRLATKHTVYARRIYWTNSRSFSRKSFKIN